MTNQNFLPVSRAFAALADLYRELGPLATSRFALTWLAAGRLTLLGKVPAVKSLGDLATEEGWSAVKETGLPIDAIEYISTSSRRGDAVALSARAVAVIAELVSELGERQWDALPALSEHSFSVGRNQDGAFQLTPALADLLLDLVGKPKPGDSLWLPFDISGVQTIQALRRGWMVNASLMLNTPGSLLPLLLAIEFGATEHDRLTTEADRDGKGRRTTTATHTIAIPPFGVKAKDIPSLAQWESPTGRFGQQYARLEPWAITELLSRVTRRAVFCVSPGVLFSGGQEHRLREYLVERGKGRNQIEAVITTPTKVFANMNVGAAIVVVTQDQDVSATRMVDLGIVTRNQAETETFLREELDVALGLRSDEQYARLFSLDEIRQNDFLLAPNRYLSQVVEVGPNAVALGELCSAIRPPALSRDEEGSEAVEMGIPELGNWRAFEGPLPKKVRVKGKAKTAAFLQQGDVILSIKGTIGRAGLVGDVGETDVVVSQSCVALRLSSSARSVTPEYLLMYLRSDAAAAQLQGLEVGSAMTHVAPATLLEAFKLPVPTEEEAEAIHQDYLELCADEAQIAEIQAQMESRRCRRWTVG